MIVDNYLFKLHNVNILVIYLGTFNIVNIPNNVSHCPIHAYFTQYF